jgi:hypothetical protein
MTSKSSAPMDDGNCGRRPGAQRRRHRSTDGSRWYPSVTRRLRPARVARGGRGATFISLPQAYTETRRNANQTQAWCSKKP